MTQDQLITSIELQFLDIDKKLTEIVHKLELNASNVVNEIEECKIFKPTLIKNEFNSKLTRKQFECQPTLTALISSMFKNRQQK